MKKIFDILKDIIPNDHCNQTNSQQMILNKLTNIKKPLKVLDLGCGIGSSEKMFYKISKYIDWRGVDIEESPEVSSRSGKNKNITTYDGVNLPFDDCEFDIVYSNQVLEHVEYPDKVLSEVSRVLNNNGKFIGQTSQLEPYHSYSLWNFTVYGFNKICDRSNLCLNEVRPSIDGVTLVKRKYYNSPKEYSKWFHEESPCNQEIQDNALKSNVSNRIVNYRKLLICGQFSFCCTKKIQNNFEKSLLTGNAEIYRESIKVALNANQLVFREEVEYAFYLLIDGKKHETFWYQDSNLINIDIPQGISIDRIRIKGFVREKNNNEKKAMASLSIKTKTINND